LELDIVHVRVTDLLTEFLTMRMLDKNLCRYGTFATGGCDGYVNVWDGNNKKRLYQVYILLLFSNWETRIFT